MSAPEPLVRLVELDELEGTDREAAESGLAQYGQLLQTWRAIMQRPGLYSAYLPFLRQVAGPGSLPTGVKEASALLVGHLNQCRYTLSRTMEFTLDMPPAPDGVDLTPPANDQKEGAQS